MSKSVETWILVTAVALVSLIVFMFADWVRADPPVEGDPPVEDLEAEELAHEPPVDPVIFATGYIRRFHESVCRDRRPGCISSIEGTRRWQAAPELAAAIVAAAEAEGIHWAVLLVLVEVESSFDSAAVGGRGERGLVQVHGLAARGHDLTTVEGQLAAGASWYAQCLEQCRGDRLRALGQYQSGRCHPGGTGANHRARKIAAIAAEYNGI